ncbi:exported protein of unknown function [Tenacibaculum sp. 190524A02b]
MKHKLILLCILTCLFKVQAQNINFKDNLFKQYMVQVTSADSNKDGEITVEEAKNLTGRIALLSADFKDVSDIKYFENIESFRMVLTGVSSLDLSHNKALKQLIISENQDLTSIHLGSNTNLNQVHIRYSYNLTTFSIGATPALKEFTLTESQLTTLNLEDKITLESVNVSSNKLTNLKLPNTPTLTNIEAYNNQLTTLSVTNIPNLEKLILRNNQITSIDIAQNTAINHLDISNNSLTTIDVRNNTLNRLDFSSNPNLETAFIAGNHTFKPSNGSLGYTNCLNLKNICASPDIFQEIKAKKGTDGYSNYEISLNCGVGNNINFKDFYFESAVLLPANNVDTDGDGEVSFAEAEAVTSLLIPESTATPGKNGYYLDIKDITELKFFKNLRELSFHQRKRDEEPIKTINLGNHPLIERLTIDSPNIDVLDISVLPNLTYLNIDKNTLSTIDVTSNTALKELKVKSTILTSIDLRENTLLESLHVSMYKLQELNLEKNTQIQNLIVIGGSFSSLDLSKQAALKNVMIVATAVTGLDFSNNPALETVEVRIFTALKNVNVTQNTKLRSLRVENFENQNEAFNVATIDVSKNTNLTSLFIRNTKLAAIDLSKNIALDTIDVSGNVLTALNLDTNTKAKNINAANNKLVTIDISKNDALETLQLQNNELTDITFGDNNSKLSSLNVAGNQFLTFDARKFTLDYLNVENNSDLKTVFLTGQPFKGTLDNFEFKNTPSLAFMCVDENYVESAIYRRSYIQNTGNYKVSTDCGKSNFLRGRVKFDINNDGCDVNDRGFSAGLSLNIFPVAGGFPITVFPDKDGFYEANVEAGSYYMFSNFAKPTNFAISPAPTFPPTIINFPAEGPIKTQDFCVTSLVDFNDLEITIVPEGIPARPGFDTSYNITYKNRGTTTQSGTIALEYMEDILTLVSANPAVATTTSNQFSWNFTDLKPYEAREIKLTLNVNKPTDSPAVNNGDILTYTVKVNGATDEAPEDNTMVLNQTVVNSYDPNDKTCLEGNILEPKEVGKYLHYLIRFENKGTADAINISIVDEIDTTKLDIKTFEPLYASHKYTTTIKDEKEVTFTFEEINLPFDDATNDGYVLFRIKTKDDLVLGDVIDNKAAIYFDFNPPIITNTERVEVKEKKVGPPTFEDYFTLSPNPTTGIMNLTEKNSDIQIQYITIHDLSDRMVGFFSGQLRTFNVSYLFPNLYFMKIHSDKGILVHKFMKVNN